MKVRVLPGCRVHVPMDDGEPPRVYPEGTVLELGADVAPDQLEHQWEMLEACDESEPAVHELEAQALEDEDDPTGNPSGRAVGDGGAGMDVPDVPAGGDGVSLSTVTPNTLEGGGAPVDPPSVGSEPGTVRSQNPPRRSHIPADVPSKIEFIKDPALLNLAPSPVQETLLRVMDALPLDNAQRDIYHAMTGRSELPRAPFREVTVVAGARSGKDAYIAIPSLLHEAFFGGHDRRLGKGEAAVLPLVAPNLDTAKEVAFKLCRDYIEGSALLSSRTHEIRDMRIKLANGLTIAAYPCTARGIRGRSNPVAVLDELAFFRVEGGNDSDTAIQAAVRRGAVNLPDARLFKISTPWARAGVLWSDFQRYFGKDDPHHLVWTSTTAQMNPSSAEGVEIQRQATDDPSEFRREYEAAFIDDLAQFLPDEWVDAAVIPGRFELPPRSGVTYFAAADPSGGAGKDAFTLTVVHVDESNDDHLVQDVIRGWNGKGIDLEGVVHEIAALLKSYRVKSVIGDSYGRDWVKQTFQRAGIEYLDPRTRDDKHIDRSMAYVESRVLFSQREIELLDHEKQTRELRLLEARPRQGGKMNVDHPRGAHDDHANVICLIGAFLIMQGGEEEHETCLISVDAYGTVEY